MGSSVIAELSSASILSQLQNLETRTKANLQKAFEENVKSLLKRCTLCDSVYLTGRGTAAYTGGNGAVIIRR